MKSSIFNTVVSMSTSILRSAYVVLRLLLVVSCKASQLVILRNPCGSVLFFFYTSTGYNAINGHCHIKEYFHQYGLCVSVLRHLRMNASFSDPDINDKVYN